MFPGRSQRETRGVDGVDSLVPVGAAYLAKAVPVPCARELPFALHARAFLCLVAADFLNVLVAHNGLPLVTVKPLSAPLC